MAIGDPDAEVGIGTPGNEDGSMGTGGAGAGPTGNNPNAHANEFGGFGTSNFGGVQGPGQAAGSAIGNNFGDSMFGGIMNAITNNQAQQNLNANIAGILSLPSVTVSDDGTITGQVTDNTTVSMSPMGFTTVTGPNVDPSAVPDSLPDSIAGILSGPAEVDGADPFTQVQLQPQPVMNPVVEQERQRFQLQSGGNFFTQAFGIDPKYLNYGMLPSELLAGRTP